MRTGPLRGAARFGRFVHERPERWAAPNGLVLALVAGLEVLQVLRVYLRAPGRSGAVRHGGVEPQAGDHEERVARVGVHGEPVALAVLRPAHVARRVHRRVDEMPAVEGLAHRTGAVVATRLEARVAAAVAVARAHDVVGGADDLLDARGGAIRNRGAMVPDLRLAVGGIAGPAAVGSRRGGPASTRQCRGRR